jgi:hypothetical protein
MKPIVLVLTLFASMVWLGGPRQSVNGNLKLTHLPQKTVI